MTASPEYYDALETRDPEQREQDLMAALPDQVAHARTNAPAYAESLKDIDPASITSREALAALPVTRKSELIQRQRESLPFGGLTATAPGALARIFASPGPIYDPEGDCVDYWRTARALYAIGVRRGDIVHNTFSYHLTPAGWMVEGGARAIGCAVIPGGVGNTEQQVMAIRDLRPSCYVGTPSFLKIILDKAAEMDADISCLKNGFVAAEPLPPSLRQALQGFGLTILQWYGTADLGMVAYETPAMDGMILDESLILEIVRPGTGDPAPEGEVGEIVITTFNRDYPLIRFATGDMSAVLAGISPCGRTNTRIKGWMGRADQTTKVRGMFVHPEQVAEVVKRHAEVVRARLVVDTVDGKDSAELRCEVTADSGGAGLADTVGETFQSVCKVRGAVRFVEPGQLANDGKVIDDVRSFE